MAEIPVWLLDIDGVINACPAGRVFPSTWPQESWVDTRASDAGGHSWRMLVAQPVLDFIRIMHESGRVEIRWHTTWQDLAPAVGEHLGLPTLPVHSAPEFEHAHGFLRRDEWWKVPGALRVVRDEKRRLIWTDDDIVSDLHHTARAPLIEGGALLVSPDTTTGLKREDLDLIEEWLAVTPCLG